MTDKLCDYANRGEVLIAYVYDDIAPEERGRFDAHLTTCARCRGEAMALGGVRGELARWSPPAFGGVIRPQSPVPSAQSPVPSPQSPVPSRRARLAGDAGLGAVGGGDGLSWDRRRTREP